MSDIDNLIARSSFGKPDRRKGRAFHALKEAARVFDAAERASEDRGPFKDNEHALAMAEDGLAEMAMAYAKAMGWREP